MITVNIVNMNGVGGGAAEKEVHADGCSHRKPYSSTSTESFDVSNPQDLAFEVGWLINNDFLGDRDATYDDLSYEEAKAYVKRIGIANLPYSVGFGTNVSIRMMPCLKKVLSSRKKSSSLRWDPSLGVDTVAGEYRAVGKHSSFTIIPEATADGDQGWGVMALHRRTGWKVIAKSAYATLIEAADWCERLDQGTLRDNEREVFAMKKAIKKTALNWTFKPHEGLGEIYGRTDDGTRLFTVTNQGKWTGLHLRDSWYVEISNADKSFGHTVYYSEDGFPSREEAQAWCESHSSPYLDFYRGRFGKTAGNVYSDVMKYFGGEAMRSFREYLQGSYGYGSSIDLDYQGLASAISAKVQQAQSLDEALMWLAAFASHEDYGVWDQWDAYGGIIDELTAFSAVDPEDVVQDLMSETEVIWSKHLRISSKKTIAGKYELEYGMTIEWRPYGANDRQGNAQGLIGENGIFTYTVEPMNPGSFLYDISDSETQMSIHRSIVTTVEQGMNLANSHSENYARELHEEESRSVFGRKKKAMDEVGKEDEDVDNDGDSDESDDYLENRRDTITDKVKSNKKKSNAEFSIWVDGGFGVDRVDYLTALRLKAEFEAEGHVVEIRQGDFVTNTNPAPQFDAPVQARKKKASLYWEDGFEMGADHFAYNATDSTGKTYEIWDSSDVLFGTPGTQWAALVTDVIKDPSRQTWWRMPEDTRTLEEAKAWCESKTNFIASKKAGLYSPSENFKCMDCGTDEDQFQLVDEDEADYSDVQCPKCNAVYTPGYSEYEEDYDGVEHLAKKKKYKRNTSALYGSNELWL